MDLAVLLSANVVFYGKSRTAELPLPPSLTTPPHVPVLPTSTPLAASSSDTLGCSYPPNPEGLPPRPESPKRHSPPVDIERPEPPTLVMPAGSPEGPLSASDPPALRRSSRRRRPALELDPTSGQWVTKGSNS